MGRICSVMGCSNSTYRLNNFKKRYCYKHGCKFIGCGCPEPFRLFPFPTEKTHTEKRLKWIEAIKKNLRTFWPNHDSRVCSKHFIDGKPTEANPMPTEHMDYIKKTRTPSRPRKRALKNPKPKKDNSPSVSANDEKPNPGINDHHFKKMEKIHVAPLSSKSIPALFAVPNTDTSGNTSMRLCKRVIYIKNGISYSNYVPVTQNEADSKNMFGVQRIVNVLDEKHQFKRHMVIKNWVNHVKPAKGNISAIPAKSPILTRPTPQIVQNTVSTSMPEKEKRKVTLPNKSIIVTYNPASTQQPVKKISPVMLIPANKVSTPQTDLKQSNLAQTNTVIKTENNIPVMQSTSAKSNIQISSVYSLSDSNVERKSKEETAAPVTSPDSSINDLKTSPKKQTLGDIVSELNKSLSHQTYTADKSSPSNVYFLMAHNGKKCLIQAKAHSNLMTHIETASNQKEESVEILNNKSKSKSKKKKSKKSEHKKNRKRKSKTKRSYSPDNSSDSDYMPEAASFQMLKGIDCKQVENKIVRKNKVLKVKLSKIPSLTNLKMEEDDSETESTSEGDGMGAWDNVVIKEEPLDPSDDSDTNGYLNSFLKEQQLTMDTIVDQPDKNMQFPLVMIKKEPVSDSEDTVEHEPGPSKRKLEELPVLGIKIKEEPISDEDTTYENDQPTASIHSQCLTRVEEPVGVCTSREDRVKQLKERIKEKQTVLAAFRKRPRISLVDGV